MPHFIKMAASQYDITPIEMAHASLIGQPVHILSPLVASTYLLVSMLDVNSGDVLFSAAGVLSFVGTLALLTRIGPLEIIHECGAERSKLYLLAMASNCN